MVLLPIVMYTDGSSKGNPGPGGYGVILSCGNHYKEFSEGFLKTTNNRMELLGIITGLEKIKRVQAEVEIYTDSKYVVDAVNKGWVFKWEKNNFAKKANEDLWRRFLKIYRQHSVTLHWVKGHADNPYNNRCDQMAVEAAGRAIEDPQSASVDTYYIGSHTENVLL